MISPQRSHTQTSSPAAVQLAGTDVIQTPSVWSSASTVLTDRQAPQSEQYPQASPEAAQVAGMVVTQTSSEEWLP